MSLIWNILARLLGVRGLNVGSLSDFSLRSTVEFRTWIVLGALALAGILIGILSYARTTEPIAARKRVLFGIGRLMVYLFLALSFSGMVLSVSVESRRKPGALVVVDDSLSMKSLAPDMNGQNVPRIELASRALQGEAGRILARKRSVLVQGLDGNPLDASGLTVTAQRTDIPSALNRVLLDRSRPDFEDLVLVTDGHNTVQADYEVAAAALMERGTRLHVLAVGDDPSFRDVWVDAVRSPPYCRAADLLMLTTVVRSRGYQGETIVLEVVGADDPDKVLADREIKLGADDTNQRIQMKLSPPIQSGELRLVVRARPLPGEATVENNAASVVTLIVDEPVKVLYVENFPRAEFKFIKRSIDRDPGLQVTFLLRMPGGSWLVHGDSLIEKPEQGFPAEIGELLKYDVLILGTISRGYFSAGDRFEEKRLSNIARFVSSRGGGLIVLGGHRSFGHGHYHGSPIDPLLPFEIHPYGQETFLTDDFQAELPPQGRLHPVVQLTDGVEENDQVWADMPELGGCNVVGMARPGAEVIAVASREVDGAKPIILATQPYGEGRVLACTSYATFRWRLGMPSEMEDILSRFWSQAVRYVSPDPRVLAGVVNMQTDRSRYVVGDEARIVMQPLDLYYGAVRNADLRLTITMPDGEMLEIAARDNPADGGYYPVDLVFDRPGVHRLIAETEKGLRGMAEFDVGVSSEEFHDVTASTGDLASLAERSGGKLFSINNAADLARALPDLPVIVRSKLDIPLWDSPLLLGLILLFWLLEWFMRKRNGLA